MDDPVELLTRNLDRLADGDALTPEEEGEAWDAIALLDAELVVEAAEARLVGDDMQAACLDVAREAAAAGLGAAGVAVATLATVACRLGWCEVKFLGWGESYFTRQAGKAGRKFFYRGCIAAAQSGEPRFYPLRSQ